MKPFIDLAKDLLGILRELALMSVFVLLFFFPAKANDILSNAGITKLETPFATWQQKVQSANDQGKIAAQSLSATVQSLQDVSSTLKAAGDQSKDPAVKQLVATSLQNLNGSLSAAQNADQSLRQTIVAQQTILQDTPSHAKNQSPTGWVYVGAVDDTKQQWQSGSPKFLPSGTAVPQKGKPFSAALTEDVYLRGDPNGERYNSAPVLGAIRAGTTIQVSDVGYSHSRLGGYFIWLKATAQ